MTRTTELAVAVSDKKGTGAEPNLRRSADGYSFYLHDTHWKLNKDINVAVGWAAQLGSSISRSYWEVLAYYAENHSGDHVRNMNSRAKAYFQHSSDQLFSVHSL
ncbi:MAG: hypothetical protein P1V33_07720, partial [Pseudohongiella nitratireducens]|nr:hypothetical protein [Pseudohongiella nitratireducens]